MTGVTEREVTLLACSSLAGGRGADLVPFGPKAWSRICARARAGGLAIKDLPALSAADLNARLGLSEIDGQRLGRLLKRGGQLAFELERLGRIGVWAATLGDVEYPGELLSRLGEAAPPVLFGAGTVALLAISGLGVVGSRDTDEDGVAFATEAGREAARQQWSTVSGGARGIDQAAMRGAWEAGGVVVGALAEGVERGLRDASVRAAIREELAVFVSPYRPDAPFSVGAAMARNKLIYGLATVTVVVSTALGEGGTWAGATEALDNGWGSVLVRDGAAVPDGNRALIERGGVRLEEGALLALPSLVRHHRNPGRKQKQMADQATLFE